MQSSIYGNYLNVWNFSSLNQDKYKCYFLIFLILGTFTKGLTSQFISYCLIIGALIYFPKFFTSLAWPITNKWKNAFVVHCCNSNSHAFWDKFFHWNAAQGIFETFTGLMHRIQWLLFLKPCLITLYDKRNNSPFLLELLWRFCTQASL